jgi:heterodisulfide reductase subunit C
VELCPQKVELTEIFILIKNRCFEAKKYPEAFYSQGQAVLNDGVAIPYSNAIITRRKKLGLPEIKTALVDEIKTLLKETNFEKNIIKGD